MLVWLLQSSILSSQMKFPNSPQLNGSQKRSVLVPQEVDTPESENPHLRATICSPFLYFLCLSFFGKLEWSLLVSQHHPSSHWLHLHEDQKTAFQHVNHSHLEQHGVFTLVKEPSTIIKASKYKSCVSHPRMSKAHL